MYLSFTALYFNGFIFFIFTNRSYCSNCYGMQCEIYTTFCFHFVTFLSRFSTFLPYITPARYYIILQHRFVSFLIINGVNKQVFLSFSVEHDTVALCRGFMRRERGIFSHLNKTFKYSWPIKIPDLSITSITTVNDATQLYSKESYGRKRYTFILTPYLFAFILYNKQNIYNIRPRKVYFC